MRKRLVHASRAATAALNALGANGGFVSRDRRGNTDAKCLLLDVAEQAVALCLPQRTKVKRRPDAYVNDEGARRGAQVSDAEAAERIAFILHWFGLGDAACVGMFGLPPVDAPDAMRKSVKEFLETNRGSPILRVDELCGRALVAAGLLTPKERSVFFLIGRTERRRRRGPA